MKRSTLVLAVHGILILTLMGLLTFLVYPYLVEQGMITKTTALVAAGVAVLIAIYKFYQFSAFTERMEKLEDVIGEEGDKPLPQMSMPIVTEAYAEKQKLAVRAKNAAIVLFYFLTVPISVWISIT